MPDHPRNVLFIICDDLRQSLDRYGPRPAYTPHLDRLKARGVTFTRAYCQSPLCTPSRASLFSGRLPDATGIHTLKGNQFETNPETVTLPGLFKKHGAFTARSGKVFHKGVPDGICTRGTGPDDPNAWCERREPACFELNSQGQITSPVPYERYPAGAGGALTWLRGEKRDSQQHDYRVADDVTSWIEQPTNQPDTPWFLAAGLARPHVPLVAPKRFFELYDDWDITPPDRSEATRRDRPKQYDQWFGGPLFGEEWPINDDDLADCIRAYYATVSFLDEQVGRMLDALESTGQLDNTMVVFTADHGFMLGEHSLFFKRFLYEESINVPLIIADPSRPEAHGQTHDEPVELLDIFPTVTEATGITHGLELDGRSLVPQLDNPLDVTERFARVQTGEAPSDCGIQGRSIRDKRWAYHAWRGAEMSEELYDLEADPLQMLNLADDPRHAETKQALAVQLAERLPWPS